MPTRQRTAGTVPLRARGPSELAPIAILMSGLALGLWLFAVPTGFSLATPLAYGDGDTTQNWMYIRRVLEGAWFPFATDRMGAPFGAAEFDYPEAEALNYLLIKGLGLFSDNWTVVSNLFVFAGFPLAAGSAYFLLRSLRVEPLWAVPCALLFAFLPYHFLRVFGGHLFLTSYWNAPLAAWLAFQCWPDADRGSPAFGVPHAGRLAKAVAVVAVGSAGIYYAYFGCFLIVVSGLAAAAARMSTRAMLPAAGTLLGICIVVAMQLSPAIFHRLAEGPNAEAVRRSPAESENYGLKMTQLVLPHPGHPLPALNALAARYEKTAPLANEGWSSSLGVLGSVGLLLLAASGFTRLTRGGGAATTPEKAALLAAAAILLGTVGGLGTIFAWTITPLIRGYNRISVFIGVFSFLALALSLHGVVRWRRLRAGWSRALAVLAAASMSLFGMWDQTTAFDQTPIAAEFARDGEFFARAEQDLPAGTMVYQLPYRRYPEAGPLLRMQDYDHARGYLHTSRLRWSYGAMKGREGDLWLRALSLRPTEKQLDLAAESGFGAVYVDRRAYADDGAAIEAVLRSRLGPPAATSADGDRVIYRMAPTGTRPVPLARVQQTLADPIEFARPDYPRLLASVEGVSGYESWGRWTDGPVARIKFAQPLPQRFTLELGIARVYGPNRGENVRVSVGDQQRTFVATGAGKVDLVFDMQHPAEVIEIDIPRPTSPLSLGQSGDRRLLGIGLESLRIVAHP